MVHVMLFPKLNVWYFYISTFRIMYAAPNMALFCNSLISCVPDVLRGYFLNDSQMVPVAPINTGISFFFLHSTRAVFLLQGLHIVESSRLSLDHSSTWSVRKVSDRIFLCEHLMDYNLARLHEPTLNLSAHA